MHPTRSNLTSGGATALAFTVAAMWLPAQCATNWQPGLGIPGTNGYIQATTIWDRDGAGPLPPLLVIGGQFTSAGTTMTNNLAAYDPVSGQWSQFGAGATTPSAQPWASTVAALVALPNGDLIAAGRFTHAGGASAANIARWNGSSWSPLGSGIGNGGVSALAVLPNGDLIAGGDFTLAGGIPANNVARWNGSAWAPLASGISPSLGNGVVTSLAVLANGDLVAGGLFTSAGGTPAQSLARWDDSSWSPMCSSMTPAQNYAFVRDVAQLANGDLIVAGDFAAIDGVPTSRIARWNGTNWSALGLGTDGPIQDVEVLANDEIVISGYFQTAGTVAAARVARWDGSSWSAIGGGADNFVLAVKQVPNGDLFAGGGFSRLGGAVVMNFGRWNGAAWSAPVTGSSGLGGANGNVSAGTVLPNGDLVVVGGFQTIGGIAANHVVRWDGSTWSPLGSWIGDHLFAVTHLPNGDVIVGGNFTAANGAPANQVARWNGSTWSPLGNGPGGHVYALAVLPNGHLVAAGTGFAGPGFGSNFVTRWDGSSWQPMAAEGGTSASALAVAANGDLLVGGSFLSINGSSIRRIARWDGATWSPLGNPADGVSAIVALSNGDVIAASGNGGSLGSIQRWNGSSWTPLGSLGGQVYSLLTLPDGDLLLGGDFQSVGGIPAFRMARFDGTTWSTAGSGCTDLVTDLLSLPNGDVIAMGNFNHAGGQASAKIARLAANCRATAQSQGTGCSGSGGQNVLTARSLPWTGGVFRASASGMAVSALVLSVYGFTPITLPMANVLPQGLPGCEARMLPDYAELVLPASGVAETSLAIPDSATLAGLVLHHYVVPFEFDASLNILAVTSSNSLQLTLGTF